MKKFLVGTDNPCDVGLFYIESKANKEVVRGITAKLEQGKAQEGYNSQLLTKILGLSKYSLIPNYLTTELTAETFHNLMDGKVIIMIDHYPIALSFPVQLSDFWSLKIDENFPSIFMYFFRYIRILGLLIALFTPAIYVSIVSTNPEVLSFQLALAISESRQKVPYPALVETLMMLLILEMIIEAIIRLPKSIGPAITMVGGIVLGQAVVQAKLVSNLLIIILAATTIANLTLPGFLNTVSVRIMKYIILVLSAFYGILGILYGAIGLILYIAGITSFKVPFLGNNAKTGGEFDE
ncbi:spore germination protein [Paenibacillus sp. N3.4]|nr:spore germination protein [Paenibacillus sp. N3.4]TXK83735.1 spore germination protein [Paenibacillus sp. N3.4]